MLPNKSDSNDEKNDTASENTILFLLVCRTLQTKAAPLKMKTLLLHVDMPISTIVMTLIVRQIRRAEGLYPFSISNTTCSYNLCVLCSAMMKNFRSS